MLLMMICVQFFVLVSPWAFSFAEEGGWEGDVIFSAHQVGLDLSCGQGVYWQCPRGLAVILAGRLSPQILIFHSLFRPFFSPLCRQFPHTSRSLYFWQSFLLLFFLSEALSLMGLSQFFKTNYDTSQRETHQETVTGSFF